MIRQSKKTLAISLAIALGVAIMPLTGHAANSGGIAHKPNNNDYTGSLDGSTVATENAAVSIDSDVLGRVYGGYSDAAGVDVKNNTVTMTSGTVGQTVYGGRGKGNVVSGNTVNMSAASGSTITVTNEIYGGFNDHNSSGAAGNTVNISGAGTIAASKIIGGLSNQNSTGNTVNIADTATVNVKYIISGGDASKNSYNNTVNISGGTITAGISGGSANDGEVSGNIVNISGNTTIKEDTGTYAYIKGVTGGFSGNDANIINNSVNILGGAINTSVYGGYSKGSGNLSGNKVNISGGSAITKSVYGAYSDGDGNLSGNTVTISGGTIKNDVYGAYSTKSVAATISGNTVTIAGGTFGSSSTIYGGYSLGGSDDVSGNTVTVTGGTFDAGMVIYGGMKKESGSTVAVNTGNTLNWGHKAAINKVAGFANYNFIIPATANPDEALLTVTEATDLSNSTVKLVGVNGSRKWAVGESVILIDNGSNTITGVDDKLNGKTTQGIKKYKYEIEKIDSNKKLQATITGAGLGDQAKSLSEGRIAALGSLNSGADLAVDKGMSNATDAAKGAKGYDAFGAVGYGNTKQKSGSYADSKGTSMMLGMARELKGDSGTTTLGFFFESGNSSYDTFNNFADAGEVRANGKNKYFGGGVMARKLNNNNVYYEGSLRVGRMNSDYNSYDIETKYDIKSTYYGLHLGIGKILKIADDAELDIYGKYLWSHQNSATAMIDGDAFNFDALDSHRLRAGARYTTQTGSNVKSYVGLAYEHELDGKAGAMTTGERVAEPSVKGGTGIAEVGIIYKPTEKSNFSMDLGVSGYAGKREGFGGQLKLNWGF